MNYFNQLLARKWINLFPQILCYLFLWNVCGFRQTEKLPMKAPTLPIRLNRQLSGGKEPHLLWDTKTKHHSVLQWETHSITAHKAMATLSDKQRYGNSTSELKNVKELCSDIKMEKWNLDLLLYSKYTANEPLSKNHDAFLQECFCTCLWLEAYMQTKQTQFMQNVE